MGHVSVCPLIRVLWSQDQLIVIYSLSDELFYLQKLNAGSINTIMTFQ